MTNQYMRQLEEFVAVLDDANAWDMLARLGWRLVDRTMGVETWENDGQTVRRELIGRAA